ncbi:unnamed protein product [Lampetra fluviatilis]
MQEGHVGQLDMENLSRPQMLSLLSFLEGELEARDLAIEVLRAHSREEFMHERYGRYRLGDPLRALQRDWELGEAGDGGDEGTPAGSPGGTPGGSRHRLSTPAALLDTVVQQWRRTRDRVTARLAAIESQHCKVMKELEDERRRHAQDLAQGDDVTFMLEKERERLEQQVDFEKSQVKKLEKEQKKLSAELREERAKSKQLVLMLVKENELLTEQLQKERSALAERDTGLAEEKRRSHELGDLLEVHKKKSGQVEAELEKQLAEFDTEREQLRLKLEHEAHHTRGLQEEILSLKSGLASKDRSDGAAAAEVKTTSSKCVEAKPPVRSVGAGSDEAPATLVSRAAGTDAPPAVPVAGPAWDASCTDGAPAATAAVAAKPREPRNGPESQAAHAGSNHARPVRRAGETDLNRNAAAGEAPRSPGEPLVKVTPSSCSPSEASPPRAAAPVPDDEELSSVRHLELSNSHDAPSAGAPARAGRGVTAAAASLSPRSLSPHSPSGLGDGSPTAASPDPLRSGYSAGLNSRFQVAKLKFQTQVEQEQQQQQQQQLQVQQQQQLQVSSVTVHGPTSPDATGARRDSSPVKNLARNTVSQAISRFASQQAAAMAAGKALPLGGSSPFGTDYRSALHSPAPGAVEPAHALHPPGRAGGNPLLSPSSPSAPGGGGGVKGPSVSLRLDRGAPPPIPPKKPSLIQGSHAATAAAATATGTPARSLAVDSNSNPSVEPLELEGEGTRHNAVGNLASAVGNLASALELPNAAVAAAAGATTAAATTCSDGCGALPARSTRLASAVGRNPPAPPCCRSRAPHPSDSSAFNRPPANQPEELLQWPDD